MDKNLNIKCKHEVRMATVMPRYRQCKRNALEGKDYCKAHDPEGHAERERIREEKWKERDKLRQADWHTRLQSKQKLKKEV